MPTYEIRKRPWPDAFKRRQFPRFWRRVGLKRPWGLYRDGKIVGMYETKEQAKAAMPQITDI